MPLKLSILLRLAKKPAWVLGAISVALSVALFLSYQKLEIQGLKNDALQSRLEDCQRANRSSSATISRLEEVQKNSERQRIEALKKQKEMLEKLYAPKEISITSEDACANSYVPDNIRLRFKPDS